MAITLPSFKAPKKKGLFFKQSLGRPTPHGFFSLVLSIACHTNTTSENVTYPEQLLLNYNIIIKCEDAI